MIIPFRLTFLISILPDNILDDPRIKIDKLAPLSTSSVIDDGGLNGDGWCDHEAAIESILPRSITLEIVSFIVLSEGKKLILKSLPSLNGDSLPNRKDVQLTSRSVNTFAINLRLSDIIISFATINTIIAISAPIFHSKRIGITVISAFKICSDSSVKSSSC